MARVRRDRRRTRVLQPTLFEVLVERAGMTRAFRLVSFFVAWGLAESEVGPDMTVEQYADWWGQPRATAFRDQQRWREALPEYLTPGELIEALGTRDPGVRVPAWFAEGSGG